MATKINAAPFTTTFENGADYRAHLAALGKAEAGASRSQLDGMRAVMVAVTSGIADADDAAAEAFKAYRTAGNETLPEKAERKPTEGKDVKSDVSRWNTGVRLAALTVGKTNAATLFLARYGDRPEFYGNPVNRFPSAVRAAIKAAEDGRELSEASFLKAVADGKGNAPETDVEFCLRLAKAIAERIKGNVKTGRVAMVDHSGMAKIAAESLAVLARLTKEAALKPVEAEESKPVEETTKNRHGKKIALSELDVAIRGKEAEASPEAQAEAAKAAKAEAEAKAEAARKANADRIAAVESREAKARKAQSEADLAVIADAAERAAKRMNGAASH